MKVRIKWLIGLLALLMCAVAFAACSGKDQPTQTDTGTGVSEPNGTGEETLPAVETDANGYVLDSIPADVNYHGKQINLLCWQENIDRVLPLEAGKDELQQEVYLRSLRLAARLNIELNVSKVAGNWQNRETFLQAARLSNESEYDLICAFSLVPSVLAQEGVLYNLNTLNYPELEKPWWPESITEWEQYNSLYFIANNSSIASMASFEVMFSNSELFRNRELEDPIDLVLENQWTVEKMLELVSAFDTDVSDESMRVYGLAVDDHSRMDAFYYSAGFNCTKNNSDGKAELAYTSATQLDRITTYIDQLFAVFKTDAVTIAADDRALMKEHRTALMVASLDNIREMEDTSYAPLPLPMLESGQGYKTIQNNGYDVWCIPTSAADPELSGLVIEALASEDYRSVAPFYFDKYMKLRYATNVICSQMFELVRSSVIYDFGRISQITLTNNGIPTVETYWRKSFWDYTLKVKYPENTFATSAEGNIKPMLTNLESLLASYRKYSNQNAGGN